MSAAATLGIISEKKWIDQMEKSLNKSGRVLVRRASAWTILRNKLSNLTET
jgi:hypothetical protein